jgi:hypothetical protein
MNMNKQVFVVIIGFLFCIVGISGCFEENKQPNKTKPVDSDGDGLSDKQEGALGTNATNPDSDGDGVYDFFETENGTAIDTDDDERIDVLDVDDDGDSVLTSDEHADENGDGDPSDGLDSDQDGILDYLDDDDDNDGILTSSEEGYSATFGDNVDNDSFLNYQDKDSDNDGKQDKIEGIDDSDGDAIPNFLDVNDNDGPLGDLDGDGVTNQQEGSMDPIPPDSNDDGIPDYLDPGSDGGSGESPTEQERFLGSWVNKAESNETWIFYANWTLKTISLVTEDPMQEPYFTQVLSNYTISNHLLCLLVLDGYSTTPICYTYEFSNDDTEFSLSYTGVVVLEFTKE